MIVRATSSDASRATQTVIANDRKTRLMKPPTSAIGKNTAAILVEPVQGEGGVKPASLDYLRGLRAVADEDGPGNGGPAEAGDGNSHGDSDADDHDDGAEPPPNRREPAPALP